MSDERNRKMHSSTRFAHLKAIVSALSLCGLPLAHASAPDPATGLPTCTVLPAQAPGVAPVYIQVDAQGNFYSTQFTTTGANLSSRVYSSSNDLQTALCDRGAKIAFWGADAVATLPGSTIEVFEYVLRGSATGSNYFISSKDEDFVFIQRGGAGDGWQLTPLRLRLPRVGDLVPVHRFLGADEAGTVTHFFTADAGEFATWMGKVNTAPTSARWWTYEGIAFSAPAVTTSNGVATCANSTLTPVFRVSGIAQGASQPKYRYVANAATLTSLQAMGYRLDGTAFCAIRE